jgi:hypothetical protein
MPVPLDPVLNGRVSGRLGPNLGPKKAPPLDGAPFSADAAPRQISPLAFAHLRDSPQNPHASRNLATSKCGLSTCRSRPSFLATVSRIERDCGLLGSTGVEASSRMRAASHSQCGSSNKLIRTSRALWIPPVAASHPGIIYEKLRPSPTGAPLARLGARGSAARGSSPRLPTSRCRPRPPGKSGPPAVGVFMERGTRRLIRVRPPA